MTSGFLKFEKLYITSRAAAVSIILLALLVSCGAKTEIYKANFRVKNATSSDITSTIIKYDLRLDNDESKRSIDFGTVPLSTTSPEAGAPIIWYYENIPIDAGAFFVTEMHIVFNDESPKDYLVFSGKSYGNQGASYESSFLKKNHTYEIVVGSSSASLVDVN